MTNSINHHNRGHLEAFNHDYRDQAGQGRHAPARASTSSQAAARAVPHELQGLSGRSGGRRAAPRLADCNIGMPPSPGTRSEHEMHWQSLHESHHAPPFDALMSEYAHAHGTQTQGKIYMPTLAPLPPSAWEQWMAEDDLALQAATATHGAGHVAQPSRAAAAKPVAVRQARAQLTDTLRTALASLEGLSLSNTDPEIANFPIKKLDHQITPLLIAAENARRPQLNLISLHTSEAGDSDMSSDMSSDEDDVGGGDESGPMKGSQSIASFAESAPPGRYRALIDNGQHTRAADIHKSRAGISIVILDSLRLEKNEQDYEDYAISLKQDFGERARCAFIPLDVQKSAFGCRIFALSLALKMQSRERNFNSVHNALNGRARWDAVVPHRKQADEDANASVILDAGPLVDARMMKHTEALGSINKYLEKNPRQAWVPVNHRHQTLPMRTRQHAVQREVLNKKDSASATKIITFNNSIELKRIALVKRALNHVSAAPPQHVLGLAALMGND